MAPLRTALIALLLGCALADITQVTVGPNYLGNYEDLVDEKECEGGAVNDFPHAHQETLDGCALICNCLDGCNGFTWSVGVGNKGAFDGDATDINTGDGSCHFVDSCSSPTSAAGYIVAVQRKTTAVSSLPMLNCTLAARPEIMGYKRLGAGGSGPIECLGSADSMDALGDFRQEQLGEPASFDVCSRKCNETIDCVSFTHWNDRCTFHSSLCTSYTSQGHNKDYYVRTAYPPAGPTPTPSPSPSKGSTNPTPTPTPSSPSSPTPTPSSPSSTSTVVVTLTVKNLDYDTLVADSSKKKAVEDTIEQEIAASAGSGITKDDVDATLKKGSVMAEVRITPPAGTTAASVNTALDGAKSDLSSAVLSGIQAIPGIDSFTTGDLSVDGLTVETESTTDGTADAGTLAAPLLLAVSALVFSVV